MRGSSCARTARSWRPGYTGAMTTPAALNSSVKWCRFASIRHSPTWGAGGWCMWTRYAVPPLVITRRAVRTFLMRCRPLSMKSVAAILKAWARCMKAFSCSPSPGFHRCWRNANSWSSCLMMTASSRRGNLVPPT